MRPAGAQTLAVALGVGAGDLVALVGGGGKTTAMYRLLRELREQGVRAAAATTTKIAVPAAGEPELIVAEEWSALRERLAAAGPAGVVLGRRVLAGGKVEGIPESWCSRLLGERLFEALVVEADGAARRPVKAPAEWEPVVPAETTVFVAVLGLSCVGAPLDAGRVFRPERVAAVTGLRPGELLTPSALARLLTAEAGLRKGCPGGARACVLLNQADGPPDLETARHLAEAVMSAGGAYRLVVAACLRGADPVRAVWAR
jgi:probable selenium-dependent hydroxylase accessory protein YqeC